jgi:hypothetical protein
MSGRRSQGAHAGQGEVDEVGRGRWGAYVCVQ